MPAGRLRRHEPLLTAGEVAILFRVSPKTVTRWAQSGKLSSYRTIGGHRRYPAAEVMAMLTGAPKDDQRSVGGADSAAMEDSSEVPPSHGCKRKRGPKRM